jgi:hypothetical protein
MSAVKQEGQMLNYAAHYGEVEKAIQGLVDLERAYLSADDVSEVVELLHAREFGLALESFSAALLDSGAALDEDVVARIQRLAEDMGVLNEAAINGVIDAHHRQSHRIAM